MIYTKKQFISTNKQINEYETAIFEAERDFSGWFVINIREMVWVHG